MLEQTAIAYMAGLFDGEGYLSIRRSNRGKAKNPCYRVIAGVTNKNKLVLLWLQSHFGGYIYPKKHKNKNAAPAFEWIIMNRADVDDFLDKLQPYVKIKASQLKLAKEFLALGLVVRQVVGRGKTWPIFSAAPGEIDLRESFKVRMTELNKRGVPQCLQ